MTATSINSSKLARRLHKGRHIHESSKKIVYDGLEPGTLVLHFKESPQEELAGVGAHNNLLSEFLMMRLNEVGIDTHLIRRLNMREQLVTIAEPLPFAVTMQHIATPAFAKRFGLEPHTVMSAPILEYVNLLSGEKEYLAPQHLETFHALTPDDIDRIHSVTARVFDIVYGLFRAIDFKLAHISLEFGRLYSGDFTEQTHLMLIDALSFDSLTLMDAHTQSFVSPTLMYGPLNAYQEILHRFKIINLP
jgi:phosphoribosylaminoimidazole-succinocarboxamide synthase